MKAIYHIELDFGSTTIKRLIINDFDNLQIKDIIKPRIGLAGEVLVKFHPTANNNVVNFAITYRIRSLM